MQLGRTANLPLDVEWHAYVGDEFFVAALQVIREKAPFSRWRTLQMNISGGSRDDAPWSTADAFTNLESLIVCNGSDNAIFDVIDRTTTSRLKILDVIWYSASPTEIVTSFAKSLNHISTLRLQAHQVTQHMPLLPANVVHLQLASGQEHRFPHICTYKIRECSFASMDSIDLRRMTVLTVSRALTVSLNGYVFLPALRELSLGTIILRGGARIEAPALDILFFMTSNGVLAEWELWPVNWPLPWDENRSPLLPGYLLSPNTSIIADSHLRSTTMIYLLAKSPKVTHATLRFDTWDDAKVVLARLFGFKVKPDLPPAVDKNLCPRLTELRLDFTCHLPSKSKEWLIDAVKTQREAGFLATLSVYEREEAYLLLTGD
jgi:hypothetical protein